MFNKLKSFYAVFTAGQVVANPVAWKRGQVTASMVAAFLGALITIARIYGVNLPLTDEQLLQVGGTVVTLFGVFNSGVTVASTDKIGLRPSPPSASELPVPEVSIQPTTTMPPVRYARNGDVLDGIDTTHLI